MTLSFMQFLCLDLAMKPTCVIPPLHTQGDRCDQKADYCLSCVSSLNRLYFWILKYLQCSGHQTFNYSVKGHHLDTPEREINWPGSSLVFQEKPLHEVCFVLINKQGNKRCTVGMHIKADTSPKHSLYSANKKLQHFLEVNFRKLFIIIRVVFCKERNFTQLTAKCCISANARKWYIINVKNCTRLLKLPAL